MKRLCLLVALAIAPPAFAAFRCVDEKGVTRIGETPPDECANVVMYEIGRSGQVIKTIDPTPTADQLKQRQADAEKRKEADKVAAEQKRKDLALLNTYSSEREVDVARDRNIDPINGRIKIAKERIAAVDKRQKALEEEMEFYKAGKSKARKGDDKGRGNEPPHQLTDDLERMKKERVALEKSLAEYDREIATIRARYEVDKQRWMELKSGVKPKEDPKGPATITLTAGAAGVAKCADKIYECPAGTEYICRERRGARTVEFKVACVVPERSTTVTR